MKKIIYILPVRQKAKGEISDWEIPRGLLRLFLLLEEEWILNYRIKDVGLNQNQNPEKVRWIRKRATEKGYGISQDESPEKKCLFAWET